LIPDEVGVTGATTSTTSVVDITRLIADEVAVRGATGIKSSTGSDEV
jgi:hypothetical protein